MSTPDPPAGRHAAGGGAAPAPTGLKDAARSVPQDWRRLGDWLAGQGRRLDLSQPPRQFSGGVANLNYLVSVDGEWAVLRRPPAGSLAEGANDMGREARVLSRLCERYPLAPRCLAFCSDAAVLGAPFQLLEFRPGVAVGSELPASLLGRPDAPARLTECLVAAMSELHALDPASVGLDDLGRPEGFLRRQVEGWARRCRAVYDDAPPPAATALIDILRRHDWPESDTSLIHGDFKFDNMLLDVELIEPVAVIDWDMATRGDPLFDLAVLLSYWVEPGDPTEVHGLRQVPSLSPGFTTRGEVAASYFTHAGIPPVALTAHLALARLRLAIAWQQLYARHVRGIFTDPRYAEFGRLAAAFLIWTVDTWNEDR